jgi:hypothetical protein
MSRKYEDKGKIIEETSVAENAVAYSDWFTNSEWINKMIFKIKSTKPYEIYIYRRNKAEITDYGSLIIASLPASSPSYAGVSVTDEKVNVGYEFRIGIVNKSGDASTADIEAHLEVKN